MFIWDMYIEKLLRMMFQPFLGALLGIGSAIAGGAMASQSPGGERVGGINVTKWKDIQDKEIEKQLTEQYGKGGGYETGEGIPEWLRPGTEIGGAEFQKYASQVRGDLIQGAQMQGALTGRRNIIGGVNRAMSAVMPGMRYQNFMDAMNRRFGLNQIGLNLQQNIMQSRLGRERTRGQYELGRVGLSLDQALASTQLDAQRQQAIGSAIGSGLGMAAGGMGGGMTSLGSPGGPIGDVGTMQNPSVSSIGSLSQSSPTDIPWGRQYF